MLFHDLGAALGVSRHQFHALSEDWYLAFAAISDPAQVLIKWGNLRASYKKNVHVVTRIFMARASGEGVEVGGSN